MSDDEKESWITKAEKERDKRITQAENKASADAEYYHQEYGNN